MLLAQLFSNSRKWQRPVQRMINEAMYLQQVKYLRVVGREKPNILHQKKKMMISQDLQATSFGQKPSIPETQEALWANHKEKENEREEGNAQENGTTNADAEIAVCEKGEKNQSVAGTKQVQGEEDGDTSSSGMKRSFSGAAHAAVRKKPRLDQLSGEEISGAVEAESPLDDIQWTSLCSPTLESGLQWRAEDLKSLHDPSSYDEDFQFLAELSFKVSGPYSLLVLRVDILLSMCGNSGTVLAVLHCPSEGWFSCLSALKNSNPS